MKTRSLLLYVPALPLKMEALLPQRGPAAAAAGLLDAGHWTRIADWGTVDALRLLYAEAQAPGGGLWDLWNRGRARDDAWRYAPVADSVTETLGLDFIVFWAPRREEVRSARLIAAQLRARLPHLHIGIAGDFIADHGAGVLSGAVEFDIAFAHSADTAILEWAERLKAPETWNTIAGAVTRGPSRADLSAEPGIVRSILPGYGDEVYPALGRGAKLKYFTVEHAERPRPAPAWASSAVAPPARVHAAARVCDEMHLLARDFGAAAIHISGAPGALHMEQFGQELTAHGARVPFSREIDPAHVTPGLLASFGAVGCMAVSISIETGSQRLLDHVYKRRFGVSQALALIAEAKQRAMSVSTRWTFPCPFDDAHTLAETMRFLERARPHAAQIAFPWFDGAVASLGVSQGLRFSRGSYARWASGAAGVRGADGWQPCRVDGWPRWRAEQALTELRAAMSGWAIEDSSGIEEQMCGCILDRKLERRLRPGALAEALEDLDFAALEALVTAINATASYHEPEVIAQPAVRAAVGN